MHQPQVLLAAAERDGGTRWHRCVHSGAWPPRQAVRLWVVASSMHSGLCGGCNRQAWAGAQPCSQLRGRGRGARGRQAWWAVWCIPQPSPAAGGRDPDALRQGAQRFEAAAVVSATLVADVRFCGFTCLDSATSGGSGQCVPRKQWVPRGQRTLAEVFIDSHCSGGCPGRREIQSRRHPCT